MVTEGAGAIAAAAIASKRVDVAGRKVVALVTGGNIDRAKLASLLVVPATAHLGFRVRRRGITAHVEGIMLLEYRAAPPFMENGYVLGCEETREGVIIDPGESIDELLEIVAREKLTIKHILLTHAHLDHITGVGRARAATGAPVMLHADDRPLYDAVVQQGMMFGIRVEPQPPVDAFYDLAKTIAFGRYEVRVHHTPGHSPGGVCLEIAGAPRRPTARPP